MFTFCVKLILVCKQNWMNLTSLNSTLKPSLMKNSQAAADVFNAFFYDQF